MNKVELLKVVCVFLNGKDLERKQYDVMLLFIVIFEGFFYVVMISVGELVVISFLCVKLLVWKDIIFLINMIQNYRVIVILVVEGKVYYIKFWLKKEVFVLLGYELFMGEVVVVKEDYVKYVVLILGI